MHQSPCAYILSAVSFGFWRLCFALYPVPEDASEASPHLAVACCDLLQLLAFEFRECR